MKIVINKNTEEFHVVKEANLFKPFQPICNHTFYLSHGKILYVELETVEDVISYLEQKKERACSHCLNKLRNKEM